MRALIVDDERLARDRLRALLQAHASVEIVGEAGSAADAVAAIRRWTPDVVFLDIEMAGGNGFEVFGRGAGTFKTVFVTAFHDYAVRAFDVQAVDYLLKPVDPERLARAVERLHGAATPEPATGPRLSPEDHLFLAGGARERFVPVRSLVSIRAAGSYTEVRLADGPCHLLHRSMDAWETLLPAPQFRRVHRATIVNVDEIARTERLMTGGYRLHMRVGPPLTVSRRQGVLLRRAGVR